MGYFSKHRGRGAFANQAACELVRQPIGDVLGAQLKNIIEFKVLEAGTEALDFARFKFDQTVNDFRR